MPSEEYAALSFEAWEGGASMRSLAERPSGASQEGRLAGPAERWREAFQAEPGYTWKENDSENMGRRAHGAPRSTAKPEALRSASPATPGSGLRVRHAAPALENVPHRARWSMTMNLPMC